MIQHQIPEATEIKRNLWETEIQRFDILILRGVERLSSPGDSCSDLRIISPYFINTFSSRKVTRRKKNID